eukprot:g2905.t1
MENSIVKIGGYQKFDLNVKSRQVLRIQNYSTKFNWIKHTLQNAYKFGFKSFMDIGCNNGLSSLLAQEVGYDNVISLDHDSEAIDILTKTIDLLDTTVIHPRIYSFGETFKNKVDVVLCGALIHWIFTCTSNYGRFSMIFDYLLSTGLKVLIIEWVDPLDSAVKSFRHLSCGVKPLEKYSVTNLENAHLQIGKIQEKWPLPGRPTRVMYRIEIIQKLL